MTVVSRLSNGHEKHAERRKLVGYTNTDSTQSDRLDTVELAFALNDVFLDLCLKNVKSLN